MGVSDYLSSKSQKELHRMHIDSRRYKVKAHEAIKNGFATFTSFLIIGFIPLLPFVLALFIPIVNLYKFQLSIVFTALALLIVGGVKGLIVQKSTFRSALETLLIGGIAAALAFFVGFLLRGLVG
jgi:vacuolar iron transporter family protein